MVAEKESTMTAKEAYRDLFRKARDGRGHVTRPNFAYHNLSISNPQLFEEIISANMADRTIPSNNSGQFYGIEHRVHMLGADHDNSKAPPWQRTDGKFDAYRDPDYFRNTR